MKLSIISRRFCFMFLLLLILSFSSLWAQTLINESFDATTFPPTGWSVQQVSGTEGLWDRQTSGTNPTCSPHSGAGMIRYKCFSLSAGTSSIIVTPALNFTNLSGIKVKFWMYRDSGYATNYDSVDVYVNTANNLTGAKWLGKVNRSMSLPPVVSSQGWYEYTFDIPAEYNGSTNYVILKATSRYGNNIFVDDITVYAPPANDLNLKELTVAPTPVYQNVLTTFTAKVKNEGLAAQTNKEVSFYVNGEFIISQNISSIAPGEEVQVSTSFQFLNFGPHSVTASVPADQNAANDSKTLNFIVYKENQLVEGFEGTIFPPEGWSTDTTTPWTQGSATGGAYEGTKYAYLSRSSITSDGNFKLMTPILTIQNGDSLVFYAKSGTASTQKLQIKLSSDKINWSNIDTLITLTISYVKYKIVFTNQNIVPGNYYLAFSASSTSTSGGTFYIDNVVGPVRYFPPFDVVINRITPNATVLAETSKDYLLEIKNTGINQNGDTYNLTLSGNTFPNPVILDKTAGTTLNAIYLAKGAKDTVIVRITVPATGINDGQVDSVRFTATSQGNPNVKASVDIKTTAEVPFAMPYLQDFNSGTSLAAIKWTTTINGMTIVGNHGTNGSNGLTKNLWSSTTSTDAISPYIKITTSNPAVRFDYRYVNYNSYPTDATTLGNGDSLVVQVSTDGINWVKIGKIDKTNHVTSTLFAKKKFAIPAQFNNKVIKVRFFGKWSAGDYYLDIDNVEVIDVPPYGVLISKLTSDLAGFAGDTLRYSVKISNIGTNNDTYNLTAVSAKAWPTIIYTNNINTPISSVAINAEKDSVINVAVIIPQNAAANSTEQLTITATSQTQPNVTANTVFTSKVKYIVNQYPYLQDFETGTAPEISISGTGPNQFVIGSATCYEEEGKTKSLYISKDGSSYSYNVTSTSTSEAVINFDLRSFTGIPVLSFYWKCVGEVTKEGKDLRDGKINKDSKAAYDYGKLYINGTEYPSLLMANSNTWNLVKINLASYIGSRIEVKFKWVNDNIDSNGDPLAIDNIELKQKLNYDVSVQLVSQNNMQELVGKNVQYKVAVKNEGLLEESYTLSAVHAKDETKAAWTATVRNLDGTPVSGNVTIKPDSVKYFILQVNVPINAYDGETKRFAFKATCVDNPTLSRDVKITTRAMTAVVVNYTNPYDEGFENTTTLPNKWNVGISQAITGANSTPELGSSYWILFNKIAYPNYAQYVHGGDQALFIGYQSPKYNWVLTPYFNFSSVDANSKIEFSFWAWYYSTTSYQTYFWVLGWNSTTATWDTLTKYTNYTPTQAYQKITADISAYKTKQDFRIAVVYYSVNQNGYQMAIDDFAIREIKQYDAKLTKKSTDFYVAANDTLKYQYELENTGHANDTYNLTAQVTTKGGITTAVVDSNNQVINSIQINGGKKKAFWIRIIGNANITFGAKDSILVTVSSANLPTALTNKAGVVGVNAFPIVSNSLGYSTGFEANETYPLFTYPLGWRHATSDSLNGALTLNPVATDGWAINNTRVHSGEKAANIVKPFYINYSAKKCSWLISPEFNISNQGVSGVDLAYWVYYDYPGQKDSKPGAGVDSLDVVVIKDNQVTLLKRYSKLADENLFATIQRLTLNNFIGQKVRLGFVAYGSSYASNQGAIAIDDLTLRANYEYQGISVSPTDTLKFSDTYIGATSIKQFTVTSTGNLPLTITNITLPAGYTLDYAKEEKATKAKDVVFPIVLQPNQSRTFKVTFSPTENIAYQGNIEIISGAESGTVRIPVKGKGVVPIAVINTNPINFGDVVINQNSNTVAFNITNNGTGILVIKNVKLSRQDFRFITPIAENAVINVNPNTTVNLGSGLRFTPSIYGTINDTLRLTYNKLIGNAVADTTIYIFLSGTGIHANTAPAFTFSQNTMAYFTGGSYVAVGSQINISGTIDDPWGADVNKATLYYRTVGATTWKTKEITNFNKETQNPTHFVTWTISSDEVQRPGIELYIRLQDGANAVTYCPAYNYTTEPLVIPVGNHSPVIDEPAFTPYDPGSALTISAVITDLDDDAIESVLLYYRNLGSTANYKSMPMDSVETKETTYQATIPGNQVTAAGIEYYVVAKDTVGTKTFYGLPDAPKSILPPYITKQGWNMLAIPYETNTLPSLIFGDDFSSYYMWNENGNIWTPPLKIRLGQGYIAYADEAGRGFGVEGVPYNSTMQLALSYSDPDSDGLVFSHGWNLIGNPYETDLDFNNVTRTNVDAIYYWWNPETKEYQYYPFGGLTNKIKPWMGVWVHANKANASLTMNPSKSDKNNNLVLNDKLQIKVNGNNVNDTQTYIAISNNSSINYDSNDIYKLAPLGAEYAYSYIEHTNWGKYSGNYAVDVVPPANRLEWNLVVNTNKANSTVTLNFENTKEFANGYTLKLYDLQTGNEYNLREVNSININTGKMPKANDNSSELVMNPSKARIDGIKYRFLIVAEKGTTTGITQNKVFKVYQNNPNPFNPTTTIPFDLPELSRVKVSVYNILGQQIRVIVDKPFDAGTHKVVWDGKDNNGNSVASGVYFYKVETNDQSVTKKMLLVK